MNNYDDLDIYNGDPEHDMWVDSDYQENTGVPTDTFDVSKIRGLVPFDFFKRLKYLNDLEIYDLEIIEKNFRPISEPHDGVAVIGISRHRLGTDGKGVTTLVAFHGCPLRCKYCLNKKCWEPAEHFYRYTPKSLYDEVKVDELYFLATGGGITFGGGEPCLQADFIMEFRRICGPDWKIRVETSLNVDRMLIDKLAPVVDEWFVDTKAERSVAYKEYTGVYRQQVMNNLIHLTSVHGLNIAPERIYVRVPIIPGYVDEAQAEETHKMFVDVMKFPNVEVFRYVTDDKISYIPSKDRGKRLCNLLRDIRNEVAIGNGMNPPRHKCNHRGFCPGTCPVCERQAEALMNLIKGGHISVASSTLARIEAFDSSMDYR